MTPQPAPDARPCNLCGGTEASVLSQRSRSGRPLRTVLCRHCGLAWSDPLPNDPRDFHAHDYRVHYKGVYYPKPKHVLRAGQVALSRYRKIASLLVKPLAILDVGAGGGEFAYLLQTLGHRVQGVEPNRGYAEYAMREYGLEVAQGFIQDVELGAERFDMITIWHVLEHTENPSQVLDTLHAALKPRGWLVIEVPNIEAVCQAPNSTFHEAHLFHFNTATLQKMAEKSGFLTLTQGLSEDGGNITLTLQKSAVPNWGREAPSIPGNAGAIRHIVQHHTTVRHYLTPHPYARLLRRARQALREQQATRRFPGAKPLLDRLYAQLHPHYCPATSKGAPLNALYGALCLGLVGVDP